jgi:peptidoglycan/xylan/chitin deacetylase (PgdA/CDA1 family)
MARAARLPPGRDQSKGLLVVLGAVRAVVKEAALRALGSGVAVRRKLRAIGDSRALTILNLHRVAPDDRSAYPPLDPALFEALIAFLQDHFEILTFADLDSAPAAGRPKLILSFDDGYRDFYDHAAPILARRGVRVNHNVIPACTESGTPPLNVVLQDFIGRAPAALIEALDVPGFAVDRPLGARLDLGNRLSGFLKDKPIAEQKALAAHLLPQLRRDPDFAPTPMMSVDELREMAEVHEIGAHSFEHANMAQESDDYLREDVARCRAWFAGTLGREMTIYAFPNGSYRAAQLEIVRDAGVRHILLVDEDFSSLGASLHRRFTFDARSEHEVRFRATGAFKWPDRAAA